MTKQNFIEVDDHATYLFLKVLEKKFPNFQNLKFKLLFDIKKKKRGGQVTLAYINLPDTLLKFFARDKDAIEGFDYILCFYKRVWDMATDTDRIRIITHELRHVFIDEKGNCRLLHHDVQDFMAEIIANHDDPNWAQKLVLMAEEDE